MTRRILLSYLTVTVVVLLLLEIPLAVFYGQRELDRFTSGLERDANVLATVYEDGLESGARLDPLPASSYAARSGTRVVVVDSTGTSVIDTGDAVGREFSTRPEFARALSGARAVGTRSSSTLGTDIVYVALPIGSSGTVHGALRLTIDTGDVDAAVHRFWLGLAAVAVVVLTMVGLVGWALARWITEPIRALERSARRFARGDLRRGDDFTAGPPELVALSVTMGDMAERLAQLLEEQRAFVADASHQLRTPLTAMRLRLENLQARLPEADAAEVDAAIDETGRLARLVGDLLQLARADGPQPVGVVDVAAIAAERVDTWGAVADLAGVTLRFEGPSVDVVAVAVPGAVEQILDNVLDNALAVSSAGAAIDVGVARSTDHVELRVQDRGPGLADEDKMRALRRFWRGSSATAGTGLGLPIAASLASASGGELRLADTPGGGLTVVVSLPLSGEG